MASEKLYRNTLNMTDRDIFCPTLSKVDRTRFFAVGSCTLIFNLKQRLNLNFQVRVKPDELQSGISVIRQS